jgi:hypothetical protein
MLRAIKTAFFHPYTDGKHQYFRSLGTYMHIFMKHNFELIDQKTYEDNGLYIFRKMV